MRFRIGLGFALPLRLVFRCGVLELGVWSTGRGRRLMFSGPGGGGGASSVGGVLIAHRRLIGGRGGCVAMDGVVVAGELIDDDIVGG